jgi:hypothetical protein
MSNFDGQPSRHARWRHSSSLGIKSSKNYIRAKDEKSSNETLLESLHKSTDSLSQSAKYQGIASVTAHHLYMDTDDDLVC